MPRRKKVKYKKQVKKKRIGRPVKKTRGRPKKVIKRRKKMPKKKKEVEEVVEVEETLTASKEVPVVDGEVSLNSKAQITPEVE